MPEATKTTPAQRSTAKPADKPLLTVNLSLTKETKGTFRYDAPQNEVDRIGGNVNIYVPKASLPKGATAPQNVTLTIVPMA
jgi:hypothetical protein